VPKVKVHLDSILQLQPELQSTLSMVVVDDEATMRYKITNLGASKVMPSTVASKLREFLNANKKDTANALAPIGTVKLGPSGCCTLSTGSKVIVEQTTASSIIDAPTTTTTVTAPMVTEIQGTIHMQVTMPSGVTADDFVDNADVKRGVAKGIAAKLEGVTDSMISVRLSVDNSRRLSSPERRLTSANIIVNYAILVPDSMSDDSLQKIETDLANADADEASWSSSIGDAISEETLTAFTVVVSSIPDAETATRRSTTTTTTADPGVASNFNTEADGTPRASNAAPVAITLIGVLLLSI